MNEEWTKLEPLGRTQSRSMPRRAEPEIGLDLAIATQGVKMVFRNGEESFWALKGIDLEVPRGDIQLLMGPSGSGKSTLLSILAGLLTPTYGQVWVFGQNITQLSSSQLTKFRLHNIGFIFQNSNLFPALTAVENVEISLQLKGVPQKTAHTQALELLDQFNLSDKADHLPRDLSGGQKQLVAVARALAGDPQIVMADEPTASLDSHSGRVVMELLYRFVKAGGHTVVMVTHDYRIVDIADRVANLEDGMLI